MSIWNSKSGWMESWRGIRFGSKHKRYTHKNHATRKSNPLAWNWNKDIVKLFRQAAQNATKDEILKMLIGYSSTKIPNNYIPYKKRRHIKIGKPNLLCFICKANQSNCYHHIILIKNGGFPNKMNTIEICNDCHALIHTWLNKAYTMQATAPLKLQGDSFRRSGSICPVSPGEIGNN